MQRNAPTDHAIQPFFVGRYSPYVFDPERPLQRDDLLALFEAARWAMSSYNAQPWRYIVGVRQEAPELWEQVLGCLIESNRAWAKHAPVLAIGCLRREFEYNGKPNPCAAHDLGAASAFLTVEAAARGIQVHQMAGIEHQRVISTFGLDGGEEPLTGLAIGYPGDLGEVDEKLAARDRKPRERRPLGEITRGLTGGG